jgi:hypothetical protein
MRMNDVASNISNDIDIASNNKENHRNSRKWKANMVISSQVHQ